MAADILSTTFDGAIAQRGHTHYPAQWCRFKAPRRPQNVGKSKTTVPRKAGTRVTREDLIKARLPPRVKFDPCIARCYGRYIGFSVSTKITGVVPFAYYAWLERLVRHLVAETHLPRCVRSGKGDWRTGFAMHSRCRSLGTNGS
jgi:hypothetical protein